MDPLATRELGRTGVMVTQMGLGGAPIGSMAVRVSEDDALATVHQAWAEGLRLFDTAPWYGRGLSEIRMGAGLRDFPRDQFVLSSKVGRWLKSPADRATFDTSPWVGGNPFAIVFDYTYDGIMRSVEGSRLRLGITRFDIAFIHDLDRLYFDEATFEGHLRDLAESGWKALDELRSSGQIGAVGAGINERGLITRHLAIGDIDAFLIAMPYTLLHQEVLDDEFPAAVERGCGFVIGAPFQSGILAKGAGVGANYNYAPAPPEIEARVAAIQAVCERHGVPLAAASLQFPLGHPAVASVIPGASSPAQQVRNLEAFHHPIPADLWAELQAEGLLRADAPLPS